MSTTETDVADIDNIIPTRGYQLTPIVGIGASAGGIAPLLELLRAMPADTGMVFVVVMHLAPTRDSTLASLVARATTMPVHEAEDGQAVEANHVYVIPPGKFLSSVDGRLRLTTMTLPRGRRNTIDLFFRTLADTHGPHAIAVVLSGADSDGAAGIKRIKERGGLTVVQDPNEAEHASMPRAAIATGMADWVLKAAEMSHRIVEYLASERKLKLPAEDGPPLHAAERARESDETALRDVLVFLRTRTGHDFSSYKRATILRRIRRRMQVNAALDLPAYLAYMRTHPGEAGALLQDLLISVTNFFRDRDAFDALARIIPSLFEGKHHGDAVRVWVPACATGEEAYSIAILLIEHAETLDDAPALQVFGCDLNDQAIQTARAGYYPDTIATDVSDERLRRFFVRDHDGFRVKRELREMVLFATHDMLKDAPFSRMDLISCRNFLIYLGRDVQPRLLEIFHFALRPGGKLLLGTSEAIDEESTLFRPLDKKNRIYVQQPALRGVVPVPLGPTMPMRTVHARDIGVVHENPSALSSAIERRDPKDLADLHFKLLERYSAPSLLVNADHAIVHLSEHAGRFLQLGGGEPTLDLVRIVEPALRTSLRAALFRARETGSSVDAAPISVEIDGRTETVRMRVTPAPEVGAGHLLVVFDAPPAGAPAAETIASPHPHDAVVQHLERELEHVKVELRDTVEQYEASTEELKASNEELQAMNEELRSATEELETSREELQSINEELTTVNHEMKVKVDELAAANSDLQNWMASTAIATVFLDRQLTIKRYTPPAVDVFNLIPGDMGRPLAHLKHKLDYANLIGDAEKVRDTLLPVEREVTDGVRWFLSRLQPYRTVEDHIGGVVLTLVDVTERKRSEQDLRDHVGELTRFNNAAVGRETRMIELKKEINALAARLGEQPKYPIREEE
jgi:two-component system CheB/CheR fusion protein